MRKGRSIDWKHPDILMEPRRPRPEVVHDPANKLVFTPTGEYVGFARPTATPAITNPLD